MTNTIRTLKTRDNATAILRKTGVAAADYSKLVTKTADGQFTVDMNAVARHLAPVAKPVMEYVDATPPAAKTKKAKTPKAEKTDATETVSSVARDLILAGRENAEVWTVLKDRFQLDDAKKSYPAWYRWQLRSKGLIAALA